MEKIDMGPTTQYFRRFVIRTLRKQKLGTSSVCLEALMLDIKETEKQSEMPATGEAAGAKRCRRK